MHHLLNISYSSVITLTKKHNFLLLSTGLFQKKNTLFGIHKTQLRLSKFSINLFFNENHVHHIEIISLSLA